MSEHEVCCVCRGRVPLIDGQLVTHRHRDQFGPCPAGQVEPDPKFPTLADAEELTMSHSAGRWVPQGIGDLIRDEYRRRGERIAELEAQVAELTKTVADCGICRLGSRTIHINDDCPRHGDTDGAA